MLLLSLHLVPGRARRELVLATAAVEHPRSHDAAGPVGAAEVGVGVSEGALAVPAAYCSFGTNLA